jgi:amidase
LRCNATWSSSRRAAICQAAAAAYADCGRIIAKARMTEPCDLFAVDARRLIGQKRLAPSELLESCIARIEAIDHAVNAFSTRDFTRARATAKQADAAVARGDDLPALHGLPIGIKDLQDTEGLRTTRGSVIFRDQIPTTDERIVAATRAAGAIVIG